MLLGSQRIGNDMDFALHREPPAGHFGQPHGRIRGQAEGGNGDPQFRFGIELVDVLAARPAAAGELHAQGIGGDVDAGSQFQAT